MQNEDITIIKARNGWFDVDLKELWKYRDLTLLLVRRNLISQYKQTVLGPIWIILNPIITSVIFTFVFGKFAGLSTDGVPQILFYLAGSIIWSLFSTSVISASNTFITNSVLMGKVYFPRLVLPISQTITSMVGFLVQFAVLMLFTAVYSFGGMKLHISWYLALIPILILQTMILSVGVGIIISSVTTKYRDLVIATTFGIQLWMYITPVVYPLSLTGGYMEKILLLNPMTPIINNFRFALFGCGQFIWFWWGVSAAVSILMLFGGIILFSKIEKTFVDTI
ncbi:MAG: ABC transporter permease [Oscillospiraceae bacterium]